jgi:hypothetical protein
MSTLHSLHGGDETAVLNRRRQLHDLLASGLANRSLPDWQAGLIIHAYGDSYAHTRLNEGHLKAYGDWFGHLSDGHTPDSIRDAPEKFLEFTSGLFSCLKGENLKQQLDELHAIAKQLPKERASAVARMQEYAVSLGLTSELDGRTKKEIMDYVRLKDVEDTMTLMEGVFSKVEERLSVE